LRNFNLTALISVYFQ